MGKIFVLVTQLKNSTNRLVNFTVNDGDCPLPELPPGKTRKFKLSKILRCCRGRENPDWTIDVIVDGVFTGMQLKPTDHVLRYVRIVFRIETNGDGLEVACIDGIPENLSDFFFRHKYFGWMRNHVWDKRPYEEIARADSNLAKKLRDLEAPAENLDPFADAIKRPRPSPESKGDNDQLKNTDTKILYNTTESETENQLKVPPESLKVHKSKGQPNVTTTAAQLSPHERSESKRLSSGIVDRTAGGGRESPNRMVKNGSDHIGSQRPIMKDDRSDYDGGNMDGFIHGLLFVFAFAMIAFGSLYIRL